jgi:hypothetical protein
MALHAYMDSMALQERKEEPIERPLTNKGFALINNLSNTIMNEYPPSYFGLDKINNLSSHTWAK